jgi:hypothetical protein
MLDVLRVKVPKELLCRMSKEERALLLLLGYTANQITVLWRLLIFATNRTPPDPLEQRVTGAQTQILVRQMIGVLWEAWLLVQRRFLGSPLGKEYGPRLDKPGQTALEALKAYFGGSNVLSTLRNNVAFHHPDVDDMEAAFQAAVTSADSEPADWSWYLTPKQLNTFYFVSDFVIAHAMMTSIGEKDLNKAHEKIMRQLAPVANNLNEFTGAFSAAVLGKYVAELDGEVCMKIAVAPKDNEVIVPFYIEMPGHAGTLDALQTASREMRP